MRVRDLVDAKHDLPAVALLIRRAGMEHCFGFDHPDELHAMAEAGDYLETRRAAFLALATMNPSGAIAPFDGGVAQKTQARLATKQMAYTLSERNRAPARD